jgi:hypothetical protein
LRNPDAPPPRLENPQLRPCCLQSG